VFRRSVLFLVVLAAVLAAPALAAGRHAAAPLFPVTVKVANGSVTISKRPARIVSLSATATESLYAVGAGDAVVAVDSLSDYPASVPRTNMSGYRPNAEAIAGYKPDLVVVRSDAGIVAPLEKLGIPVLVDPEASNLAEAYEQIRVLGRATGHPARAVSVVRQMQKKINAALRSANRVGKGLAMYHELTTDFYSTTSKSFIGQIYRLFGLQNIADAAGGTGTVFPQLSSEYIVSASPDLIFLADSKCCGQNLASVAARPGWSNIKAVRNKHVIALDDDVVSRWGPRVVQFVQAIGTAVRAAQK
jgi:iron complex transport system substrate-binding protein